MLYSSLSDDEQELRDASKVRLHKLFKLSEIFGCEEESEATVTKLRQWIDEIRSDDKFLKKAAGYNRDGLTPLHLLCMNSNPPLDVVQTLIAHAPETLQLQESLHKCLPLHILCCGCDCDDFFEIVKAMVEAYPDGVSIKNRRERLPIHEVCDCSDNISNLKRKLQILDFLIEKYPKSILDKDEGNLTPSELFEFSIEIYLEENQDNIQNKNEHMFLLHQVIAGEFSKDLVKFFLRQNPESLKLQDGNGMTPLHHACINCKSEPFSAMALVFILVHVSPESCIVKDISGRTPVQLFRKEASSKHENGMLAMHDLARSARCRSARCANGSIQDFGCSALLFLFQSYPESVSMPDDSGTLPFHYAALNEACSIEFVMQLVSLYPECVNVNN